MRSLRLRCGFFRPPINAADLAGIWCVGSDAAFALCRRRCSSWRKGCRQSIGLHWVSSALWLEFKLCIEPYEADARMVSCTICNVAGHFHFDAVA